MFRCIRSSRTWRLEELNWRRRHRSIPSDRWPPISPRLRPHHLRDRCGDDRAGRYRDALLRHPEGAPGTARSRRRESGSDHLQDRRTRRRPGEGTPRAQERDNALSQARFRVPVDRPVQPGPRPGHRRDYHDETPPAEPAKTAHFCSMCGPVLLDAHQRRRPRLCGEEQPGHDRGHRSQDRRGDGGEVRGVRRTGQPGVFAP